MAPSKPNTSKNTPEVTPYGWCYKKKLEDVNLEDLKFAYRLNLVPCPHYCRRTCKKNPRCLWGLGEKKWIRNNEESQSDEEGSDQMNRNEGQLAGITNLGATCYVNSLLQLWFHNPILRPAILKWKPSNISETDPETGEVIAYQPACPISHLQAMFARMLLSKKSTIDPTQFTTSLSLNTGEQQDVTEFANLLLTFLDNFLEKHQSKDIQNLIKDSFTWTYAYETTCETCRTTSVRNCDFRELELQLVRYLKDSLAEFLKIELLTNGNRYSCGQCGEPRDAQRRIQIIKIPPVLNLQLMRFVYDLDSRSKKKNKQKITFPEILDMSKYVNIENPATDDPEANVYVLNAVLTHKGSAANHGHYIAHIKDISTGNWFECNDDSVQPVKSSSKTLIIKNEEHNNNSTSGDSKVIEYTSDGAYMLVYTKKSYMNSNNTIEIHDYLKNMVDAEDQVFHEEYMKNKIAKDNEIKRKEVRQEEINLLYRDLLPKTKAVPDTVKSQGQADKENIKSNNERVQPAASATRSATSETKLKPIPESPISLNDLNFISNSSLTAFFDLKLDPKIQNKGICCPHGKLRPPAPNAVSAAYRLLPKHFSEVLFERYQYDVRLTGEGALCFDCVKANCQVLKNLVDLEEDFKNYTDLVKVSGQDPVEHVWISSDLSKNWKKYAKQEIELASVNEADLSVVEDMDQSEAVEINGDLRCEHGLLSPNVNRTAITFAAWSIIHKYFPKAVIWPGTESSCATCLGITESNYYVQQQNKEVANTQKAELSNLFYNRQRPDIQENSGTFYLIPTSFVNEWKRFLKDPAKNSFPVLELDSLLFESGNKEGCLF